MAAMGSTIWGMLTVENTPENAGSACQNGQKVDAKKNTKNRLTNQSIS